MKSKRMRRFGLGIMMLIFITGSVMAQDEPVFSADITLDYNSKYIWRGIQVVDESVFQPGVSGSAYGFTGSIWANIDMTDFAGTAGEFSEIDYALDYSGMVGDSVVGYSLGVIHYIFPTIGATDASTTEIYGGLSLDVLLSPYITWYRDVNVIDGSYIQMGVGHSVEMEMAPDYSIGLDLSGSFAFGDSGYNNGYFGVDETKWNDFTFGVGVPFNLKHVTLTPGFNVSTMLSEEIGDALPDRTNVWFGVSLAKSF
ncbi:MAG: hypothetical protein P8Y80_04085 [Acidobacteriota bacterium]|jgi:uncharacterized protein (TIGR02001 family)